MTYNFLYLVNRLCHKLGEVELTSSTFPTATGVYEDFMESVNSAILDIYQEEDNVWPFAWTNTNQLLTVGTKAYANNGNAIATDWNSFYIRKVAQTPDSITTSGTTATVTQSSGHPHQTGDSIYVSGANQVGYNGYTTVTVLSSTSYTYVVAAGTISPATGTILIYPSYTTAKLRQIDYLAYLEEGWADVDDESIMVGQYGKPSVIVRMPDNSFIFSAVPDRIYNVNYCYYTEPADLSLYSDVPTIPAQFKQVIVDGAMYHAYMFRDNTEEATASQDKFLKGVNDMRRILIPQQDFMRIDASIAT